MSPAAEISQANLLEALASRAFSRVADASQTDRNSVTLLRDGTENYPAWLDAIRSAEKWVHLENYIIEEDSVGRSFAAALTAAAGRGVRCRVLYDWLGCRFRTSRGFWTALRTAGVEVRCYNPPRLGNPLGWISRDHRKLLCVDGQVGFTGGLCIGHDWVGDSTRGVPPWRDTAVALRGPAVAFLERAFAESWATTGSPVPSGELPDAAEIDPAGDLPILVIAGRPDQLGLYRLELLIAELVERSLWLSDAYFVATTAYVRALCGAAKAGVDVRLLVPGSSNWPVVRALSRAGYRPLLEAGVRVFEWNGPMMHAKTAVADGCWSRVGSSNSNLASWISNRELDATIQDRAFAREMEATFESDLANATEIVLERGRVRPTPSSGAPSGRPRLARQPGSAGRLVASAVSLGSAVGASLSRHRALGPAESRVLMVGGALMLAIGLAAIFVPRLLAYPLGALAIWIGLTLVSRGWRIRAGAPTETGAEPR